LVILFVFEVLGWLIGMSLSHAFYSLIDFDFDTDTDTDTDLAITLTFVTIFEQYYPNKMK
jgi:hypothetical protein